MSQWSVNSRFNWSCCLQYGGRTILARFWLAWGSSARGRHFSGNSRLDSILLCGPPRQSSLWKIPLTEGHVWQHRFYDFVVFTEKKRVEKLRYMHRNPVVRGLVPVPEQWNWSSYRHYALGERGPVLVNEAQKAEMRVRGIA